MTVHHPLAGRSRGSSFSGDALGRFQLLWRVNVVQREAVGVEGLPFGFVEVADAYIIVETDDLKTVGVEALADGLQAGFAVDGVQALRIVFHTGHDHIEVTGCVQVEHVPQQVRVEEGHIAADD